MGYSIFTDKLYMEFTKKTNIGQLVFYSFIIYIRYKDILFENKEISMNTFLDIKYHNYTI